MTHQCYTASGTCFFQIKQGDTIVDTTQDFYFKVKVDPTVKPINDSYVSSLIAMENHLLGATQKTQAAIDQLSKDSSDAQQQAQAVLTKINSDFTDYSNKYNKLSSDWQAQEKAINDAATNQLADLKTSNKADITAAVKSINDQRDAALKQLNDEKTKELADIQSDYNSWKTSTVKDFNDTVQPIKDSISENDQKLTTVSKQVSDAVTSMDSLKQQFDKVDFSKFVTGDTIKNYYTKEETDLRLQQAGKVKSVDNIQPDSNGNINTDHYTKDQANQKLATKLSFVKCDSPQAAYDASKKAAADGSPVIAIYDMDDGPTSAVIDDKTVTISTLNDAINALQTQVSGLSSLQSVVDGKADKATVFLKTDAETLKFTEPKTAAEIAASISEGLLRNAVCAKIDGALKDLSYVVDKDCELQIITMKDKEGLQVYRHTAAHVLAQAVKNIYPTSKLAIGPTIENGFYYDIEFKTPITKDEMPKIENDMKSRKNSNIQ